VQDYKGEHQDPDIRRYQPCTSKHNGAQLIVSCKNFDRVEVPVGSVDDYTQTASIHNVPTVCLAYLRWYGAGFYVLTEIIEGGQEKRDAHIYDHCAENVEGAQFIASLDEVPSHVIIDEVHPSYTDKFNADKLLAHLKLLNPGWEVAILGKFILASEKESGDLYYCFMSSELRWDWGYAQTEHSSIEVLMTRFEHPGSTRTRYLTGARELPEAPPKEELPFIPRVEGPNEEPPAEKWGPYVPSGEAEEENYFEGECSECHKVKQVRYCPDPYDHDVNGETNMRHLCDQCHEDRCAEV
jgi:hypothetical protein